MVKNALPTPNEILLLDTRLRKQKKETYPDLTDDEYFLVSSVDTLLRVKGLSSRQIEDGIVEGGNDGGIDAVYVFIDGHLVEDTTDIIANESPQIELEVIQAKAERGFKEVAIQRLLDHLPLLLQLDADPELGIEINPQVLERFESFRATYLAVADKMPDLTITVRYATKSVEPPHEKVQAKVDRLERKIKTDYPNAAVFVDLVGASVLNARTRDRKSATLNLRLTEGPISSEKGGLICLVSLADYYQFITNGQNRLRDEIFEENVRDFEGNTLINRGIADSLKQGDSANPDFWWLNNGVTILGRRVQPSGKRLDIEDPQIVNGLQTSRSVYQYFHNLIRQGVTVDGNSAEGRVRQLLVRVIETTDDAVAAQIIKATNSQNRVSAANLRSAEPFQRDIEEYFKQRALFYERKKNHYKNLGKSRRQIVEVLELAQAVGSILRQQPNIARRMPSALLRDPEYGRVFSTSTPLEAYYNCLQIVRITDKYLSLQGGVTGRHDRSNIRFHLARSAASFALVSSRPKASAVAKLDLSILDDAFLKRVQEWVLVARNATEKATGISDASILAKGSEWASEIDRRLSRYTQKVRWPKALIAPR
ncbi:AIPR family protein [Saccharothrix sp. 6-C]|uniref:AIPR family protein n=1 Tax=Saccharothrix sp. 6-C TaxID=2781735 RepID=UPI0019173709|nr:AIPR family protein [Saccharothrix sp. 6-C]QQQ76697.1 AIPR family protein [Saccharothrix sp. 6-C]